MKLVMTTLLFSFFLFAKSLFSYTIVFVHIGSELPPHLTTTISQARLFNRDIPIVLIASEHAIKKNTLSLEQYRVGCVSCESLTASDLHLQFKNNPNHNMVAQGLFRYSTERFFFLEEWMRESKAEDVIHLECDIMLYKDLADLMPCLKKHYQEMIGATFENDGRCVAGLVYISTAKPLTKLIQFFPEQASPKQSDMEVLADFKNVHRGIYIDHLPILMPEYNLDHHISSSEPDAYSNHIDDFECIFDGEALGVYLAGLDSRYHAGIRSQPGFMTNLCVFKPSFFQFVWEVDAQGRKVPSVVYNGKKHSVVNLHITNKAEIERFYSLAE